MCRTWTGIIQTNRTAEGRPGIEREGSTPSGNLPLLSSATTFPAAVPTFFDAAVPASLILDKVIVGMSLALRLVPAVTRPLASVVTFV